MSFETNTFRALGDSYTIGHDVAMKERWPEQLCARLATEDFVMHRVDYVAETGWTTSDLLSAIDGKVIDSDPCRLVSLSIGVNNQYQGLPIEAFEDEFGQLLKRAIDMAGGSENVIVLSIPDYGVTPFGAKQSQTIAAEIDHYNEIALTKCRSKEVAFVDVTDISRRLGCDENALAEDQLHPSGHQYGLWTDKIFPVVKKIFKLDSKS